MTNLIKKKQVKKNLDQLKKTNYECSQVVNYLLNEYDDIFSVEEKQTLNNLEQHLINLNVVFNDMQKSM